MAADVPRPMAVVGLVVTEADPVAMAGSQVAVARAAIAIAKPRIKTRPGSPCARFERVRRDPIALKIQGDGRVRRVDCG